MAVDVPVCSVGEVFVLGRLVGQRSLVRRHGDGLLGEVYKCTRTSTTVATATARMKVGEDGPVGSLTPGGV